MNVETAYKDRMNRIAEALLHRSDGRVEETPHQKWGEMADYSGTECPKNIANKFLLGCLLDFWTDANKAWMKAYRFIDEIARNPNEIWAEIAGYSKEEWESEDTFKRLGLHWMHKAHNRIWWIAKNICFYFEGDARKIWNGSSAFDALCRLSFIGAGEQISRMIVGALKDCGQISGKCDVKADVYVCRVLGRVMLGDNASPGDAIELARELYAPDPWKLDNSLWHVGKACCHASSPTCSECYLRGFCRFASKHVGA